MARGGGCLLEQPGETLQNTGHAGRGGDSTVHHIREEVGAAQRARAAPCHHCAHRNPYGAVGGMPGHGHQKGHRGNGRQ